MAWQQAWHRPWRRAQPLDSGLTTRIMWPTGCHPSAPPRVTCLSRCKVR